MRSILEEHGRDRTFCRCVIWVIVLYELANSVRGLPLRRTRIHFARSKKHRSVLLSAVSLYMYLQDVSGYIQLSVRRQEGVWRQFSSEPIRGCSMALQSSRSCTRAPRHPRTACLWARRVPLTHALTRHQQGGPVWTRSALPERVHSRRPRQVQLVHA